MSFFDFNWNIYSGISPVEYSSIDSTTSTPSNYTEDELDNLYTDIFNDVATNSQPKSKKNKKEIIEKERSETI